MIEEPDVRKIAFATILPGDSLLCADAFDTDQNLYSHNAIMSTSKVAVKCHEALERLVLAVFEGLAANTVCAVARVDHDVIGGNASRKQIGVYEDTAEGRGTCFRSIRYEGRPDGEDLANLEWISVARKV